MYGIVIGLCLRNAIATDPACGDADGTTIASLRLMNHAYAPTDKRAAGFTLLELLIAMTIIGILAGIALPVYLGYTIRAQVAEGLNLVGGAESAEAEYITHTGRVPADNLAVNLPSPTSISGHYVSQIQVAQGSIVITYGNQANQQISGDTLILSPMTTAGSIAWQCRSLTLPVQYVPSACQ